MSFSGNACLAVMPRRLVSHDEYHFVAGDGPLRSLPAPLGSLILQLARVLQGVGAGRHRLAEHKGKKNRLLGFIPRLIDQLREQFPGRGTFLHNRGEFMPNH